MTPVSPTSRLPDGSGTISPETIDEAVRLLVEASRPSRVILFGSYARGDPSRASDLDFLVVLHSVESRRAEMVRLRRVLRPLRVPVDILVTTERQVYEWGHLPGLAINAALTEGKVMYEAA